MAKQKIFYGWWVALVCFLLMALGFAMVYSCNSIYITYVTQDLGISRSAYSVSTLLSSVSGMLIAPFAGKLMMKKDMRYIMAGALSGLCITYGSLSFIQNIYHLYIICFIQGMFFLCSMTMPISILLTRWFVKMRGTVLSMVFAGSSLGGMILVPTVNYFISLYSWRITYRIMAAFMFAVLVPAVLIFIRNTPQDKDLKPYGSDENQKNTDAGNLKGFSLQELKTMKLFFLFLSCIIVLNICSSSLQHIPSHMIDRGLSSASSATIVSLYLGLGIIGKILLGVIFDKFGIKPGLIFGLGTLSIGFAIMIMASSVSGFTLMAVFYGIGLSSGTVFPPILTGRLFGAKHYGEVYGFVTSFVQLGAAIGPLGLAALSDISGSYNLSWSLCILFCIYIIFTIIFINSKTQKLLNN